ncbi:MAG: AbrB/MazE/SpoVT family DNA-binding domain-containing protein [Gammaproteobacteria bacterium]|nr:AbrB/MazE/SpoVT family DNA-binding domain-containing protein [Gammaproteobacteria bacterium]MYE80521.1 AbrB/MazE/SpoVT family DNA-binding domain-containing protein [Gammaproteobacteria bacterium]
MAIALTVTAKGQVTLRKEVLHHLGVRPGDKLSVDLLNDHRIQLRPKPGDPASTIFGLLKHASTRPMSVEEINEATAAGWAGEE